MKVNDVYNSSKYIVFLFAKPKALAKPKPIKSPKKKSGTNYKHPVCNLDNLEKTIKKLKASNYEKGKITDYFRFVKKYS